MRTFCIKAAATAVAAGAFLSAGGVAEIRAEDQPQATKPSADPSTSDATSNKDGSRSDDSAKPLTEKLKDNEGVLKPPAGVDPEMHKTPPAATTKDKMPVIVPPGEPGGDQSVQPK